MHQIKAAAAAAGIEQGSFPYYFAVDRASERARMEGGKRSASDKKSIRLQEHHIALMRPADDRRHRPAERERNVDVVCGARSIRRDGNPIG